MSTSTTSPGFGTGTYPFTPEMARGMTEATLQGQVLHTAAALGWLCYHTHDSRRSQPGFPDLTMAHPLQRRLIFAELKTERGRQSGEQHEWERVLRQVGHGEFYLWRPSHWLSGEITRILQGRALRLLPISHQREPRTASGFPTGDEALSGANTTTDRKSTG